MTIEFAILAAGILLLAGTLSSRISDRVGVPSLLLFLLIGMLAGSEGIGGIAFDAPAQAQAIGTVALMVILFAGGLESDWQAMKPVLVPGLVMSTAGVMLTMLLLSGFAWLLLGSYGTFSLGTHGLGWTEALLLAAVVSSTDAAAVFSVYRTSPVQPRQRIRSLLEFESGSNDPMAVLLTTTVLGLMTHQSGSGGTLVLTLVLQFLFGGLVGAGVGWLGVLAVNRLRLSAAGLYPILVLAMGMSAFGLADLLNGNSFLAVYLAGLIIGNGIQRNRAEVMNFHDGLSWFMQIMMFVMLGLLVFPSQLLPVAGVSLALALFLILIARPLAVLLCYGPFRPGRNELAYVSWVGLRGSTPIVLATFPATYGIPFADEIFHLIFFIVLVSILVQGMTLVPAARWLGVSES